MKDKSARILAIVALVFIGIFSVTLVLTLVDYHMLNNSIGFISLGSGVFGLVIFFALKADGRGFSITKMNNEIEMQKLEKELEEQAAKENSEATEATETEPAEEPKEEEKE